MAVPDYMTDRDAVLKDDNVHWRHKVAPSYKKSRDFFDQTKTSTYEAGSLPDLVNNLVKNWEIEASYKPNFDEWRTVDHSKYYLSLNGGPKISGEDMLKVGTYNALLGSSQFYDPKYNDFEASHKAFKRTMPSFVWDVVEVYSGPPTVTARWRHWGEMKNDWTGKNHHGDTVRVKAHGGILSVDGILVAKVSDSFKIEGIDIWYDPMTLFNEIAREAGPGGIEVIKRASEDGCPKGGDSLTSACPFASQVQQNLKIE